MPLLALDVTIDDLNTSFQTDTMTFNPYSDLDDYKSEKIDFMMMILMIFVIQQILPKTP